MNRSFSNSSFFQRLLLGFFLFQATGCGLLIGNVKPVDEKSESYGVLDLSQESPDWVKLDPVKTLESPGKQREVEAPSTEISDVAFQSKRRASIISLNSACREGEPSEEQDLKNLTDLLFLGISEIEDKNERGIIIQGAPALETTLKGKLNNEPVKMRSVVLKKNRCVYDLLYMTRPEYFLENEGDFAHFVASLRLK